MLLIKTRVGTSSIHGNGVFADEAVAVGQPVWRFDPKFDRTFPQGDFDEALPAIRDFLAMYAYRSVDLGGDWLLSGDHARFLNHSDAPNTVELPFESRASRPIAPGDEITCDYGAFCEDWDRAEVGGLPALPHDGLYTRIGRSRHGIGVIAIRDIAPGVEPFAGDYGATVRIPAATVDAIEDDEIKRMYLDFCPLHNGAFIAPANFNQLTIGWHVNHSDRPNLKVDDQMRFIASALIAKGEELTTDYATYSESAKAMIATWKR